MKWTDVKPTVIRTRETKCWDQVIARIEEKIERVPESGCWIWMGATTGDEGYSRLYLGPTHFRVHKLLYELTYGLVPEGLVLDHLCRVRLCVNPSHLEAVTDRVNILRGMAPGVLRMNAETCASGHRWDDDNTRWYGRQRVCRSCERDRSARRRNGQWSDAPIPEPEGE